MNVSTLEAPQGVTAVGQPSAAQRSATAPTRTPARPGRRTGRGTGPQARPARGVPAAPLSRSRALRSQACTVEAPTPLAAPSGGWRLTERGIALVLVTGLLIVTAALTVVGLTALRVTGERYAGAGQTVLVQV